MAEKTTRIGRYEIKRKLGGGGMGQVFLAHDPRFPRDVALKLLQANLANEPALRQRFRREARTIAGLEHHAIVPVYDYGEHEGQLFLVMRLMRGGTLQDRLARGRLSLAEVQAILVRIASALDKAHEQDIVHRDLKPANILFDDEGKAYLSDFGIVKRSDAPALTATHGVIGTPQYMSPEQALGDDEVDARSDIYSLGALSYEMLSGDPPYVADTVVRIMLMHVNEPVPSLASARPDLPQQLDSVLSRAMAKVPQERFATAGDFVAALSSAIQSTSNLLQSKTILDHAPIEEKSAKENSPQRWPYFAGGAVFLMLAVAFVILLLLRPGQEGPAAAADGSATADRATTADNIANAAIDTTQPSSTPTATGAPTNTPTATPPAATSTPEPTMTATSTLTATPEPTVELPAVRVGADGLEMRLIPAGTFLMGSTEQGVQNAMRLCRDSRAGDPCGYGEFENEMPEHAVYLDAYYLDVTEVTNAHYRACVTAGNCTAPTNRQYFDSPAYDNFPVVFVSWYDARGYCLAIGERLPTEAEWEKAARSDDGRLFPWGPAWDATRANTQERGGDRLQPVGQYPSGASPYGILDLSGSVWEWVSDWFDPSYYLNSPEENPTGPAAGSDKVLRGGSFSNHVHYARSTNRGFESPNTATTYRGFRCALPIPEDS